MSTPREESGANKRPSRSLGLIKDLGERLRSDERAPYEVDDHDDTIDFSDPTGEMLRPTLARTSKESAS
jgi:hypothetical protein